MTSIWSILSPQHIHQGDKTADDPSQVMGSQVNHLSGHADSSRDCRASSPAPGNPGVAVTVLGFIVNQEKSVFTLTQKIKFLGLEIDSRLMELSLPGAKLRQIKGEALVSARSLSQFIGKLNAAA